MHHSLRYQDSLNLYEWLTFREGGSESPCRSFYVTGIYRFLPWLYLLTGEIPNSIFDGEGKTPHKRGNAKKILMEKVENETILNSLNYFFDKAFSNNISERYHSAADMRREMETLNELRFNILGGKEMNDIVISDNTSEGEKYRYSELIRYLNPSTELCNPEGLKLPIITDVPQLVEYAIALPTKLQA